MRGHKGTRIRDARAGGCKGRRAQESRVRGHKEKKQI